MTEQNVDQGIVMPLPPHIEAMRVMAPRSESNQRLTWEKSQYWNASRGDVLPHHQAVFGAYAAFVERQTLGALEPEDFSHSKALLKWATGVSPRPDMVIALDPVRGQAMRSIFEYKLEKMQEFAGDEAVRQMLSSYRTVVRAMVDSHWMDLPPAQTMDEQIGGLRECNTQEKLSLLENRIRKNAQELVQK